MAARSTNKASAMTTPTRVRLFIELTRRSRKTGSSPTTNPRVAATQNVSFTKNGARGKSKATSKANLSSRRSARANKKAPQQPTMEMIQPKTIMIISVGAPLNSPALASKKGMALGYDNAYSPKYESGCKIQAACPSRTMLEASEWMNVVSDPNSWDTPMG